jgi:hypothetical protein
MENAKKNKKNDRGGIFSNFDAKTRAFANQRNFLCHKVPGGFRRKHTLVLTEKRGLF